METRGSESHARMLSSRQGIKIPRATYEERKPQPMLSLGAPLGAYQFAAFASVSQIRMAPSLELEMVSPIGGASDSSRSEHVPSR